MIIAVVNTLGQMIVNCDSVLWRSSRLDNTFLTQFRLLAFCRAFNHITQWTLSLLLPLKNLSWDESFRVVPPALLCRLHGICKPKKHLLKKILLLAVRFLFLNPKKDGKYQIRNSVTFAFIIRFFKTLTQVSNWIGEFHFYERNIITLYIYCDWSTTYHDFFSTAKLYTVGPHYGKLNSIGIKW